MKLTKQSLRQMIKEAAELKNTNLNRWQHAKATSDQSIEIRNKDSTLSNKERSLIQQVETVLSSIAEYEGVDLEEFRAQLNAVLVRLRNATGAELGGKKEVEEQLEEGATRFDPEPRREPQEGEIEIMKGRGAKQKWFYVSSAEDAMTLVTLGRNWGYPTGIIQNNKGEWVHPRYSIGEER